MKTNKFDSVATSQAAARKAHFASGGTVGMWRGRAATFQDRKHAARLKACRGRVVD